MKTIYNNFKSVIGYHLNFKANFLRNNNLKTLNGYGSLQNLHTGGADKSLARSD